MIAFSQKLVYTIRSNNKPLIEYPTYPGVAQLGSEATAAGGGVREPSEWLRSARDEGALSPRTFAG